MDETDKEQIIKFLGNINFIAITNNYEQYTAEELSNMLVTITEFEKLLNERADQIKTEWVIK